MQSFNNTSFLIFLAANAFNEDEFITVKNILVKSTKRIFITSDENSICIGSKSLRVKSDINFNNVNARNFAGLILIGGTGCKSYWSNKYLHKIVNDFLKENKIVAAICTAPIILAEAGILINKSATCNFEDKMELVNQGVDYRDRSLVVDGNVITADSPKSSEQFAEAILQLNIEKNN